MEQLDLHRLHFAFTIVVHYIFPQLTMGLALLLVVLKTMALRGDADADASVRFWSKIFGVTFVMGVVTGIPMEFQFGTNWARFSAASGGVIGHTLAMEGVFAFFLESSCLYLVLFGEKRLGPRGHWLATVLLFFGTWLSGYFIVCTNAWMQHPVGSELAADGTIRLTSLAALLTNPWAIHQYLHTMVGAVITGSFVMAAIGAFYLLRGEHLTVARRFTSVAVVAGFIASGLAAMPTGDVQAKLVYRHQPVTFAAMEGHFHTEDGAGLVILGQPNMETLHLDNPLVVPGVLSFLTHQRWNARIEGLSDFERDRWPTNVPLLYYSYHIMAGLGTIFLGIMALAVWSLLRGRLQVRRWLLWILMLSLPFPFIANTAGWMTAELGRQPWIIYDVMRTADAHSTNVSAGNTLFTLLGFGGLYLLLCVLYFFLTTRIIARVRRSLIDDPQPMTLEITWFCLLWWMLATYVVLDGFDLGVGVLHLFVARNDAERRQVLRAVGPVWDGNEVWLLAAGGTMVMAFPMLYAASFSGFYLPLMIVLWLLVARGLGIELRHQLHDPLWTQFWDVAFALSSLLLVVCFGAALGNVVRGVPFTAEREFFEPLWTNFRVGDATGILDWYTVLVGVTALAALTHHGALWLAHRTDEAVEARARRWALRLWPVVAALSAASTAASFLIQPNIRQIVTARPALGAFAVIAAIGLVVAAVWQLRGRWDRAFTASSVFLYGMVASAAAGIFPYALPARDPALGMTIQEAAAPEPGLVVALYWWIPGMLVVCAYTGLLTYRMLPARFALEPPPD